MSASGFKVTVLCPTGHRVTVKVSKESPILEILREVCRKRNLDVSKHRLKHHKTVLDNGLSVRFANLPNNANLELEELDEAVAASSKPVKLALQFEGRPRVIVEVPDSLNLAEVVGKSQDGSSGVKDGEEAVVVYMRREIVGEAELRKVTLRDLGIVSGMSAAIRVFYKKPELLRDQAHVPGSSLAAPKAPSEPKEQVWRPMKANADITLDQIVGKSSTAAMDIPAEKNTEPTPALHPEPEKNICRQKDQSSSTRTVASGSHPGPLESAHSPAREVEDIQPPEPPVLHYQGSSKSVIFKIGEGSRSFIKSGSELSDDFFEMTIDDVKLLYKDNKKLIKDLDEGQELLTKGMRDSRQEGLKLTLLQKYKKCMVRVQFGVDALVVQSVFTPGQTIQEVKNALKEFLVEPEMKFYLYTTPPKKILDNGSNMLDNGCVPAALLHFCADEPNYKDKQCLKPDLKLSNVTGVEQSIKESGVYRAANQSTTPEDFRSASSSSESTNQSVASSNAGGTKRPLEHDLKKHPEDKKVPKWLSKGKQ